MINYFVTRRHPYTIEPFCVTWPNAAGDLIRIVHYETLPVIRSVERGIYLFSDIERLSPEQLAAVGRLCDLIGDNLGENLIVNHPQSVLCRFRLLETLAEKGINQFRVFRTQGDVGGLRYPAFLRMANDHNGPLSGLLLSRQEYDRALASAIHQGRDPGQIIAVEFCDTRGADGWFRKYSAFRIGQRIVPGHVIFSHDWVTKDSPPEPLRQEEQQYLDANPHERQLMDLFNLAGIGYGRIDYGLLDGKIQVWEINTNPTLIQGMNKYAADKLPVKQRLVDELSSAFVHLHEPAMSNGGARVPVPMRLFDGRRSHPRRWMRRLLFGQHL
jgi:hypothetical protein